MFTSSVDILNLILAICVLGLTIFLCWSLYYFIASAQKIHSLLKRVESGVSKAEEIISVVNTKLKSGSAYLMILTEVAKQALEFVKSRSKSQTAEKSNSRTGRKK
jgi:hypothetical protein